MSKLTAQIQVGKFHLESGDLSAAIKIIDADGTEKMFIACDNVRIFLPDELPGSLEYEYSLQDAIKSHYAIIALKRAMTKGLI